MVSGKETAQTIGELTPDVTYAIALRVVDMENMIEGLFGEVVSFTTNNGTPSAPRAVELVGWRPGNELLSVSWAVPMTTNGSISQYEVVYADSPKDDCEELDGEKSTVFLSSTQRNLETRDVSNIINSKSFIVCVRAYTDRTKPGSWGVVAYRDGGTTSGLQPASSESNCNGLIAVAIVAALAVLSTVVAAVILFIVYRRRVQVGDDTSGQSSDNGQPESSKPGPIQRLDSTGPLLQSNGSLHNP